MGNSQRTIYPLSSPPKHKLVRPLVSRGNIDPNLTTLRNLIVVGLDSKVAGKLNFFWARTTSEHRVVCTKNDILKTIKLVAFAIHTRMGERNDSVPDLVISILDDVWPIADDLFPITRETFQYGAIIDYIISRSSSSMYKSCDFHLS